MKVLEVRKQTKIIMKGGSLPDVDNDIQGSRRDEVKRYIEERYGENYVAGIGTYGTFKVRAALKDMIREIGGDSKEANYISAMIRAEDQFFDLFQKALDVNVNTRLYNFIKRHSYQINQIPYIFQQPKTQSIHAAGVIIVPKDNDVIQRQLPVKKMDGVVITEWEGNQIEEAGFLKVDILGIKQLDKFDEIIRLVKQNYNKTIILNEIPLNEKGVYTFFQQGFNEDVFQFGGGGLKNYCKELLPDNIEDLIATVALYRPGPMEIGAHQRYAQIKNGMKSPSYYYGLEEITKPTHSQIVYQEQIMRIVQELGGFSLVEADDIRKAMGKKIPEVMAKYKQQFIDGAVQRGCPETEALQIWMDMEGFAGYAFNRSHATCYGITGYYSQWLKYSYPLEFWLISLKYSSDKEIQDRIAEIHHIAEGIQIQGPDINKSKQDYFGDTESQTIYWALSSIKYVGATALQHIMELREKSSFYDFDDFIQTLNTFKEERRAQLQPGERMYSPLNRRSICYLIIAGAFDKIEKIESPKGRAEILKKYFCSLHPELNNDPDMKDKDKWKSRMGVYYDLIDFKEDHKWIMEQRKICGFGSIDFITLLKNTRYRNRGLFATNSEILELNLQTENQQAIVSGVVEDIIQRKSKNGPFVQVKIHDGVSELYLTIWNDIYQPSIIDIDNSKGKILFMNGEIKYDNYKNQNTIHSKPYTQLHIF